MKVCIVGSSRCGTTVLREALHRHDELSIINETHWLPKMFEFYGTRRVPYDQLLSLAERTAWDSGKDLFSVNLAYSPFESRGELMLALTSRLAEMGNVSIQEFSAVFAETLFGEVAWGDKTPDYGYYMHILQSLWPACRFVHIVRDGIATAKSMERHSGCQLMVSAGYDNWCSLSFDGLYKSYARRKLPLSEYLASWRRRVLRIRDESRRLSPRTYLEVSYEELIDDPEAVLKMVTCFLQLTWSPGFASEVRGLVGIGRMDAEIDAADYANFGCAELLFLNQEGHPGFFTLGADAEELDIRRTQAEAEVALSSGNYLRSLQLAVSVISTELGQSDHGLFSDSCRTLAVSLNALGRSEQAKTWWETSNTGGPLAKTFPESS